MLRHSVLIRTPLNHPVLMRPPLKTVKVRDVPPTAPFALRQIAPAKLRAHRLALQPESVAILSRRTDRVPRLCQAMEDFAPDVEALRLEIEAQTAGAEQAEQLAAAATRIALITDGEVLI